MGATGADEVKVTGFNDTPPTIELFSPESGRSYYEDQKVRISVRSLMKILRTPQTSWTWWCR